MSVAHDLIDALWQFIENGSADGDQHQLRERVRTFPDDTGKEFDEASSRFVSLSSWKLQRKMYALLVGVRPGNESANVGSIVCVEVPDNCTVHDADARHLERILSSANQLCEMIRSDTVTRTVVMATRARPMLVALEQLTRAR